jgi:AraC-like DNA-binding protein
MGVRVTSFPNAITYHWFRGASASPGNVFTAGFIGITPSKVLTNGTRLVVGQKVLYRPENPPTVHFQGFPLDVLSNILSLARISGSLIADIRCRGQSGLSFGVGQGAPFHYILKGNCRLITAHESLEVHAGDLLLVPQWVRHGLAVSRSSPMQEVTAVVKAHGLPVWTHGTLRQPLVFEVGHGEETIHFLSGLFTLDGRGSIRLLEQLPTVLHLDAEASRIGPQLHTALSFVSQEHGLLQPGYEAVASRLMDLLFIQILRAAMLQRISLIGDLAGIAHPKISRALAAIHSFPARRWSVADLAAEAQMSRTLFADLFRKTLGVTPMQYLSDWRLQLAERALIDTRSSVDDIRAKCGFHSQFAFSRAFKRFTGHSPRAYRNQQEDK